jgi:hypothetical protein
MKTILKRLERVEALIRPEETAFSHLLRQRIDAGCRRVTQTREREGLPPLPVWAHDHPAKPLTIVEILHLGRTQNALAPQETVEALSEPR